MRKMPSRVPLIVVTAGFLSLSGCLRDTVTETQKYTILTPVYTLKSTVLASINGDPGTAIVQPGQLYLKGSFIYVNDVSKGIHIIDNSDPSHPVQTAWLNIPGNTSIAIRGNTMYGDMSNDLLAIDITNPRQVSVVGRMSNFFPRHNYSSDSNYVLTGYVTRDTVIKTLVPGRGLYSIPGTMYYTLNASGVAAASSYAAQSSTGAGIAGSESSMALIGNYLYAIPDPHYINVVDVSDAGRPTLLSNMFSGFDLETIFPMKDKLVVGSKEGVYVYSIDNTSHQPIVEGEFSHGTACDPVIVDQPYAYVTLRSGTNCGGASNELDVLEFAQDITQSSLLKSYPMSGPSGLGKDGSLLFICDGSLVKVFDATDPTHLKPTTQLQVRNAYDVIASNHLLIVVGSDGIYEYDYTDPGKIALLSHLPLTGKAS
jgi:hypothetical protein